MLEWLFLINPRKGKKKHNIYEDKSSKNYRILRKQSLTIQQVVIENQEWEIPNNKIILILLEEET